MECGERTIHTHKAILFRFSLSLNLSTKCNKMKINTIWDSYHRIDYNLSVVPCCWFKRPVSLCRVYLCYTLHTVYTVHAVVNEQIFVLHYIDHKYLPTQALQQQQQSVLFYVACVSLLNDFILISGKITNIVHCVLATVFHPYSLLSVYWWMLYGYG